MSDRSLRPCVTHDTCVCVCDLCVCVCDAHVCVCWEGMAHSLCAVCGGKGRGGA